MSDPVLFTLLGTGLGIGLTLAGLALAYARKRERAADRAELVAAFNLALAAMEERLTEKALGMARDITQVRAATPVSLTPKLDAIEAEKAAFDFAAHRQMTEEHLRRFNELMGRENK